MPILSSSVVGSVLEYMKGIDRVAVSAVSGRWHTGEDSVAAVCVKREVRAAAVSITWSLLRGLEAFGATDPAR